MIKEFDIMHLILANDLHKKATMHHKKRRRRSFYIDISRTTLKHCSIIYGNCFVFYFVDSKNILLINLWVYESVLEGKSWVSFNFNCISLFLMLQISGLNWMHQWTTLKLGLLIQVLTMGKCMLLLYLNWTMSIPVILGWLLLRTTFHLTISLGVMPLRIVEPYGPRCWKLLLTKWTRLLLNNC